MSRQCRINRGHTFPPTAALSKFDRRFPTRGRVNALLDVQLSYPPKLTVVIIRICFVPVTIRWLVRGRGPRAWSFFLRPHQRLRDKPRRYGRSKCPTRIAPPTRFAPGPDCNRRVLP